jgi:hypothetical protein
MPKSSANRWNKKRVFRLIAWLAAGVIITVAGVIGWRHSTLRDIRGSQQSGATARQIQVEVVGLDTKPISGARVEIIAGKSSSIRTTDAGGKARFSVAASEKAKMIVQASGYARKILAIDLSQNTNVLRIRVAPGAELAGQVRDDLGAPVPKATLTFRVQQTAASEPWTIESDDQGRFSVTTLDPGSYLVEAQARNHERAVRPDAIAPSDEPLTMELRRTAKLLGTVTSPDGNPAAGAQVTFAGSGCWPPRKTMSNSEGKFEATELVAGIYEIRASNKNSASEPVSDLQLEPGDVRSVHLLLAEGHVLQVEVVDAQSEKPIANADITVAEEALSFVPVSAKTDAAGQCRVEGLRQVNYSVSIKADGYVPVTREQRTPGTESHRFMLWRAGTLFGKVLDEDGKGVAGAWIEVIALANSPAGESKDVPASGQFLSNLSRFSAAAAGKSPINNLGITQGAVPPIPTGATIPAPQAAAEPDNSGVDVAAGLFSDASGAFRIEKVAPGNLQVIARADGYAPAISKTMILRAGGTLEDIVLTLPRGGSIEGRLLDYRGFPVGNVRIELRGDRDKLARFQMSGADGTFRFPGVWGAMILSAHPLGRSPTSTKVLVSMRKEYPVELVLQNQINVLSGRVVDERSFPVAEVGIRVVPISGEMFSATFSRSRADGTFSLTGLPDPPYKLVAEHPGYAQTTMASVAATSKKELSVTLRKGGIITGQVSDQWSRKPIASAQVTLTDQTGGFVQKTFSAKSGNFEYQNVAPGNYFLVADKTDYVSTRKSAIVPDRLMTSQKQIVDITVSPGGAISGQVIDPSGSSVSDAEITAGGAENRSRTARSDRNGRFRLNGIIPGEATLVVRHASAGSAKVDAVRVFALQETPGIIVRLPGRVDESPEQSAEATTGNIAPADAARAPSSVIFENRQGAVVAQKVAQSSKEYAVGLREGDIIVAIGGEPVYSAAQAHGMLKLNAGTGVVVEAKRAGKPIKLRFPRR